MSISYHSKVKLSMKMYGKARFTSYFCPLDCSRAAIVVWSKMRTQSRSKASVIDFPMRMHRQNKRGVLLHSLNLKYTGRCLRAKALGTKFAEEFLCEHGTSFRQICEPNPARARNVLSSNLRTQSRASAVMCSIRRVCADKTKEHHKSGALLFW